ncbi:MAG: trimethylamine methyltransferase family protein, partial [Candidatus Puniceispirillales bacterium]
MIEKNMPAETRKRHGRKKRNIERIAPPSEDYFGALDHPFPACNGYDEGMIDQMHQTALDILENEGIKVLHPEARRLFQSAGASIDEESQMVWIG